MKLLKEEHSLSIKVLQKRLYQRKPIFMTRILMNVQLIKNLDCEICRSMGVNALLYIIV